MKTKKLVSLIMAGAMTLALAVPAFAATTTSLDFSTYARTYEAQMQSIEIEVDVPPAEDLLVLNPYGITSDTITDDSQVIFPTQSITSTTPVPLAVSAQVKVTVANTVKLATSSVAAAEAKKPLADKQIFLFLALEDAADTLEAEDYAYSNKADNQLLYTAKDVSKDGMATIPAGSESTPGAVYFKVLGDCSSQPTLVWAEADSVSLSTAFAFVATPVTEEA